MYEVSLATKHVYKLTCGQDIDTFIVSESELKTILRNAGCCLGTGSNSEIIFKDGTPVGEVRLLEDV